MDIQIIVMLASIVFFILCFFIKGIYDEKRAKYNFINSLKNNFGKYPEREYKPEQYANISKYFQKNKKDYSIDDITWNDLDMDSIFINMNHAYSSAGEEYLYYRLRTPQQDSAQVEKDEQLIQYFGENKDTRVKLQYAFHKMGKTGKYSLYDYLEFLKTLGNRSNVNNIIWNLAYLIAIALIFLNPFAGIFLFVIILCYNLVTYSKEKGEIEPYIVSLMYVLRVIDEIDLLDNLKIDILKDNMKILRQKEKIFAKFRRKSRLLDKGESDSDPLSIMYIYIKMMFHLDLIIFNTMLKDVRNHCNDINDIMTEMGYIESSISIAAYRACLSKFCVPEFESGTTIQADEIYHPLISEPVKNTFTSAKGVLLTGSNASGKSTFLKTVAINVILAQTINTCLADRFVTDHYRIYTSMSLKDDLNSGESYYIVEIKALKRIMDAVTTFEKQPVLCFIDEVLRGTNTVERIAASTQIMRSLTGDKVKCFAATHDIELTHLLEKEYDNYHFEEEIIDNDVVFNYRLMTGKATTRNAIKLLSIIGYQNSIIEEANAMAANFLEKGVWECR